MGGPAPPLLKYWGEAQAPLAPLPPPVPTPMICTSRDLLSSISLFISHTTPQVGEVWYEVAGELAQEGLRPVTPDQEMLQEVLHSHEEKAENTLRLQVHPNTL